MSPRKAVRGHSMASWTRRDGSNPRQSLAPAQGYLAMVILDLVNGERYCLRKANGIEYRTKLLSGGAELWWDAAASILYAVRLNGGLQGNEAPVFERFIRGAGFKPSKASGATISAGKLNAYNGVKWTLTKDEPKASSPEDEPMQGALF